MFDWLGSRNYLKGYSWVAGVMLGIVALCGLGAWIAESNGWNPDPISLELPNLFLAFEGFTIPTLENGWTLLLEWAIIAIGAIVGTIVLVVVIVLPFLCVHLLAGLIGGDAKR